LADQKRLSLSLAGAQFKVPLLLIDGKLALPVACQTTTHILKPLIEHFLAMTENKA